MRTPREHFEALGRLLAEEEAELSREAALRDPGEKMSQSLAWSGACLDDYRRLLAIPEIAAAEDMRAWAKADLHIRWREMRAPSARR